MGFLIDWMFLLGLLVVTIPFFGYGVLYLMVRVRGYPAQLRGWPLMRKCFKRRLVVFEKKANGYEPVFDWCRRKTKANFTDIFQTIRYADIPAVEIRNVFLADGRQVLFLVMEENGEFHPISSVKPIEGREIEVEITTRDGKKEKRMIKNYELTTMTQEQKIFVKDAMNTADSRFRSTKPTLLDKLLPMIPYIIIGFFMIIMVYEQLDGQTKLAKELQPIAIAQQAATENLLKVYQTIQKTPSMQNFSWEGVAPSG